MDSIVQTGGNLDSTSLVFLVVLMAIIVILLLRSRRQITRPGPDWSPMSNPRPTKPQKPAHHLNAPEDFVQWEVQMREIAREVSAKLDTKMSALAHLIREADRAAARLEAAMAAVSREPAVPAPGPLPPVAPGTGDLSSPSGDRDVNPEPASPPPRPRTQAEALTAKTSDGAPASREPAAPNAPARAEADRRYEEIYLLADYGFDLAEIARRVTMPIGEVQLILGLRSRR